MNRTTISARRLATGLALIAGAAFANSAGAQAWETITPAGAVTGLDGRAHEARCSGFPGTDAAFKFWARRGTVRKLLVYFEGGGACWDSYTCTQAGVPGLPDAVPQYYTPAIAPGYDPSMLDGIFNLSNASNPVKDWDMVYVPYCTADLHGGMADRGYANTGHPVLPLPSTFAIHHGGYSNTMVVLDWIRHNLGTPDRVLVAGSSAGGYGATLNYPWLQVLYPQAKLAVLADAAQGVTTRKFDRGTPGRGSWNMQLPPWGAGVDPKTIPGYELIKRAARATPHVRVGQFTTNFDEVQIGFYGLINQLYGPPSSCKNLPLDWNRQMVTAVNDYRWTLPNYRHYIAHGSYHTALAGPEFYSERSAGMPLSRWVGQMVSPHAWSNAACRGCLATLPCAP